MTKNDHFETKNVIFDRFWPVSKFYFPACSTLIMFQTWKIFWPQICCRRTKESNSRGQNILRAHGDILY